jgi:hypothetical protein
MSRRFTYPVVVLLTLLQFGCIHVDVRDAVAAGVFDFVSRSVTAILSSLVPIPGM